MGKKDRKGGGAVENAGRGDGTELCGRKLEALICQVESVNYWGALKDAGRVS